MTLLGGLRARGHEAVLVAQPDGELRTRARAAGIEVVPIRTRGEFAPFALRELRRCVREREPDVVHCHTAHSHMHGLLACVGNRRPRLVVSRRVDFSIHKLPLRLALWKYGARVDRIIAISRGVQKVLIDDGVPAARIGVVLSGLDPERGALVTPLDLSAAFGIPDGVPVVATVAALVGHKGHRYLVDAVPAVLKEQPAARFLFVGGGPLQAELRKQAEALGVGGAVHFAGFRDDFLAVMAACTLYVMPSYLEGLNTSVIDAMFLGRPVVATDAGGLPELIEDRVRGRVVPARQPAALAEAICESLAHSAQAAAWAGAARAWAEQHVTADCMVDGTVREYEAALEQRR